MAGAKADLRDERGQAENGVRTVLIVSELDLRFQLGRTLLWRSSVERTVVAGSDAAIEACRSRHPHLVVIDGRDQEAALSLVRRLRRDPDARHTAIAVLSGCPTLADESALRGAGANVVFTGRVDPQLWDARLEELLNVPRRREVRIPVRLVAWSRAESLSEPIEGLVLNISVHGVLLECPVRLAVGTKLEISIRLPGDDFDQEMLGEVVREAQPFEGRPRNGVKFLVLRGGAHERIQHFVEVASGVDPTASLESPPEGAAWRAQLRAAEARNAAILDSVLDCIVSMDVDGRIVEFNRAAEDVFGHRREEVVGRRLADVLVPPALQGRDREGLARYLAAGEQRVLRRRIETTAWRADGSEFPVELAITQIPGESRLLFTACLRDITERRRAEEGLRSGARQFRALFENARDAMLVADGEGRCVEANSAAGALLGLSREQVLGHWLGDFTEPGFDFQQTWDAFQRDQTATGELCLVRTDGSRRQVEFTASADFVSGSHLLALRDVTEKRQLEEQYRQSQKMEAIGRLAGGVAHDFNNLLNVIGGYGELVLRGLTSDSPLHAKVKQILRAAERAAGLTRQLLAFGRKQVLQPRVLDLNQVVGDVAQMLGRLVGDDIELVADLAADVESLRADPGQIDQVLMNLVVNARDAMPKGGRVVVRTRRLDLRESCPWGAEQAPAGRYVLLEVEDSGAGMTADTRRHVFEPFFTTKQSGTGLGLATVYGIIKQSDGYIAVESLPGQGTTFRILLPRVRLAPATAEREGEGLGPRGAETILLVEDQDLLLGMIREVLQAAGYRVLEARNGEEALCVQAAHEGVIDLLLTDLVMPGMSGAELTRRLAAARPSTKVMYMSGYTDDTVARRGILDPETAFLQKPFAPAVLEQKVRTVLDRGPASSSR